MPLWNKTTLLPGLTRAEKRNVIATSQGFVRRIKYTDVHGNVRRKDELLVAIGGVANSTNFGAPTITDMWFTNTTQAASTAVTVTVAFDEEVKHSGLAGSLKMTVANTAAGASGLNAVHTATATSVVGADNQLVFSFTPTVAGTYKIQAQTIANSSATAANLVSRTVGAEAASRVISGLVSNTASTIVITA